MLIKGMGEYYEQNRKYSVSHQWPSGHLVVEQYGGLQLGEKTHNVSGINVEIELVMSYQESK